MDNIQLIEETIQKINDIRETEFKINNHVNIEKKVELKEVNANINDFRNFKSGLIKRSIRDKSKPFYQGKQEYEVDTSGTNILKDDIFEIHDGTEEKQKEKTQNMDILTKEEKMNLIKEFISRKSIEIEENQIQRIEDMLDNPEFSFKKNIVLSKTYNQISKILFLKKLENGSHIVDFSTNKHKNKNIFFK